MTKSHLNLCIEILHDLFPAVHPTDAENIKTDFLNRRDQALDAAQQFIDAFWVTCHTL